MKSVCGVGSRWQPIRHDCRITATVYPKQKAIIISCSGLLPALPMEHHYHWLNYDNPGDISGKREQTVAVAV